MDLWLARMHIWSWLHRTAGLPCMHVCAVFALSDSAMNRKLKYC